jgi:hypothetical protein
MPLYVAEFQFRYNNRFNDDIFGNGYRGRMRFRCIVLALALLAAFASDSWGESRQPPPKTSQQNSTQQERGTDNSPVVVKVIPPERSKDDLAREDAKDKEKLAVDSRIASLTGDLAFYTKLLFVATAVLALITAGLVIASFSQVSDAREAIAAAVKSANAAVISADVAKLNAQAIIAAERAYVFVEIFLENVADIIKYMEGMQSVSPRPIMIQYRFTNYGKTPAFIREISYGAIIAENLPRQREYSQVLHLPTHLLGAEQSTKTLEYDEFKISAAIAESIRDLKDTFWFYGKIVYDDMFDRQKTHEFVFHVSEISEGFTLYRYEETEEKR